MELITADDPLAQSADVVGDNLDKLRDLFPEAFTEGRVDFDVLRQLLGDAVDDGSEKYGLTWYGKRRARQLALTPSTGTLRPAPEESVDWDTTQNLMIEGDNLEVLKLLQKSYAGRVKLIYIDPPYNTGNDFVYEDDYKQPVRHYKEITGQIEGDSRLTSNSESSGRFHTDWLNMIYPRLRVARDLLSDDGILFVSLDNGEVGNFRLACDEVFGEENLIEILVWRKRQTQANLSKFIAPVHEFVLVYAKDINRASFNRLPYPPEFVEKTFSNPDDDPRGPYQTRPLAQPAGSKNPEFEITLPNGRKLTAKWSCSPDTFQRYVDENRLYVPKGGQGMPRLKIFLSEAEGLLPNTWLSKVASMEDGSREVSDLFPDGMPFDFPKPTGLIQRVLQLASDPEALVMDFFAGSGTTGHAVWLQNAEDGGNRRFLLVQLPQPLDPSQKEQRTAAQCCDSLEVSRNLAELTKERLRRAARRIGEEHPGKVDDLGFRVYKLDDSNIRAWSPDPDDLEGTLEDHLEHLLPDRTEQDVLVELLLKLGLDLTTPIDTREIAEKTVYSVGMGTLFAALPDAITADEAEGLAEGIAAWRDELDPAGDTTVVVRDGAFVGDVAKTNFAAILNQRGVKTVRSL